jgi:hypothetical protein
MARAARKHASNLLFSRFGLLFAAGVLTACGNDTELKRRHDPPAVDITAPEDGSTLRQGRDLLALTGLVDDSFDSPDKLDVSLTIGDGEPIVLIAADDGTIATEASIDDQPVGPVTIVLTAVDTDGESASDSIVLDVGGPLGAPTVEITTPEEGATFDEGDTVSFRGDATDSTTAPDDLVFTWNSDLDGELVGAISSGGASALIAGGLSAGTHTITLTATDTDGESGSASIIVVVAAEVIEAEPGDLVFSEMMVDPNAVDDTVGEWVELYNTSGSPIDVAGYTFRDDDVDSWVLDGPLMVAAGDYVVLCADMDTATNGGIPCDGSFFRDSTGNGLALANGPDELVLTRPDGTEIDWLHYDDTWYTVGVALGLDPGYLDGGSNDDPTHWCDQTTIEAGATEPGTPGAINDPCEEM